MILQLKLVSILHYYIWSLIESFAQRALEDRDIWSFANPTATRCNHGAMAFLVWKCVLFLVCSSFGI